MWRKSGRDADRAGVVAELEAPSVLREEPAFFGSRSERMFGVLYRPEGPALGAVVIASPLHEEYVKNQRREVLLARALAARGLAVQRFTYRGAGHSEGESADLSFDSMLEDLTDAAARLARETGVRDPVLVGTRLAALLVASANESRAPLVLWEPVLDPKRYFREVGRFKLMRAAAGRAASEPTLLDELAEGNSVDVLGYEITPRLFDSTLARDIATAPVPPAAFLLQLRRNTTLAPEYARLADRWRASGAVIETRALPTPGAWWFADDVLQTNWSNASAVPFVDATCEWIVHHAAAR